MRSILKSMNVMVRGGGCQSEAARRARNEFGNISLAKEECREVKDSYAETSFGNIVPRSASCGVRPDSRQP